jgi:hypothetical protein
MVDRYATTLEQESPLIRVAIFNSINNKHLKQVLDTINYGNSEKPGRQAQRQINPPQTST